MSIQLRQPNIVFKLREESADELRRTLATQPEQYENISGVESPATLEEWTEQKFPGLIENFGLSFFHELVNDPTVGTKIWQLKSWLWDFSDTPWTLLLADKPCIFTGDLDSPNLAIVLPVSPRKAFMATRGRHTEAALHQISAKELVRRINDSSVRQATEYLYGTDATHLTFIKNRRR
jgi:hypothetical protein